MFTHCWHFPWWFPGANGTESAGVNQLSGEKRAWTAFQQSQPQLNSATPVRCRLTSYWLCPQSTTSPPPEAPAANVMNASINNTFPIPQKSCWLQPAIWSWNRPHSTDLRPILRSQKAKNCWRSRFPWAWFWESSISHQCKQTNNKKNGEERETRPERDCWRNKPRFSAVGSSSISCPLFWTEALDSILSWDLKGRLKKPPYGPIHSYLGFSPHLPTPETSGIVKITTLHVLSLFQQLPCPWDFSWKKTGVGSFPPRGPTPSLPPGSSALAGWFFTKAPPGLSQKALFLKQLYLNIFLNPPQDAIKKNWSCYY